MHFKFCLTLAIWLTILSRWCHVALDIISCIVDLAFCSVCSQIGWKTSFSPKKKTLLEMRKLPQPALKKKKGEAVRHFSQKEVNLKTFQTVLSPKTVSLSCLVFPFISSSFSFSTALCPSSFTLGKRVNGKFSFLHVLSGNMYYECMLCYWQHESLSTVSDGLTSI